MTDLSEKFGGFQTQVGEEHDETITAINAIKGGDGYTLSDLAYGLGLITTAIDNLSTLSTQIIGLLETINSNAALNAQNQQNIALGAFNACCDDTVPGVGLPDEMCEMSQALIDIVMSKLSYLGVNSDPVVLPTIQQLVDLFTFEDANGVTRSFMSAGDAGTLLAALAQCGAGALEDLAVAGDDTLLRAAILGILGTSNSAAEAVAKLRKIDTGSFDASPCITKAVLTAYTPSLINWLWDEAQPISPDGYTDICGDPGPPPFTGYRTATTLVSDEGFSDWSATRATIDLGLGGDGNLDPTAWPDAGSTLYFYNCSNAPDEGGRDTSIYLATSNATQDDIFLEIPLGEEVAWVTDGTRFVYMWCRGVDIGEPAGVGILTMAWGTGEAETHCPS